MGISRSTWCNGKVLMLLSLSMGLVCAAFLSSAPGTSSETEEPSIDMFGADLATPSMRGMTCPRSPGLGMSVNAMQDKLQKLGVPSSPLAKYVLTQYAATRDVS